MRRRAALIGAAATAAVSVGGCRFGRNRSGSTTARASPPPPVDEALWVADRSGTIQAYDGRVNRVTARVDTGLTTAGLVAALAKGNGLIWVYALDGRIVTVDPMRARVAGHAAVTAASPPGRFQLIHAHGALWILQPARLWRVPPAGKVSEIRLPSGFAPRVAVATPQSLWLAGAGGLLARVDPKRPTATPGPRLPKAAHLIGGTTALYALPPNEPRVWLLDPATAAMRSTVEIPHGELVSDILEAGADQWMVGNNGMVTKVTGGSVARQTRISDTSQDFPSAVALGALWVCDEAYSKLVRLDLATGEVVARIPVSAADPDDPAFRVVAGERSVWLVDSNLADGVLRVNPDTNQAVRLAAPTGTAGGATAVVAAPPTTGGGS